jgi:hypothetical protein
MLLDSLSGIIPASSQLLASRVRCWCCILSCRSEMTKDEFFAVLQDEFKSFFSESDRKLSSWWLALHDRADELFVRAYDKEKSGN